MPGPLQGIRVIEWAAWQQGSVVGMMLGEMGAEVIKVERPGSGDILRTVRMIAGGVSVVTPEGKPFFFEICNHSKKAIAVDVGSPDGQEIMKRLVMKSDVFITNFLRPTVEALKMDYETLRKYNDKLVYLSISGLGSQGTETTTPTQDFTLQARAGTLLAQRSDEDPHTSFGLADQTGAAHAAMAVLGGIIARERLGVGQKIESSALGGLLFLRSANIGCSLMTGENLKPIDRKHPYNPLYNVFRGSDKKWFVLGLGATADRYWPMLCKCLGKEDLVNDSRFATAKAREKHAVALTRLLESAFATQPSSYWLGKFKELGIPSSIVNRDLDLEKDPQVIANNYIINYDHPTLGKVKVPASAAHYTKTPAGISSRAPELGEHTDDILIKLLGFSEKEMVRMRRDKTVG